MLEGAPLTVCGKPLSPRDRKVWQQAIALLVELKVRNGIGEKDLAGAVETALHHSAGGGSAPGVNIQPTSGRIKARRTKAGGLEVARAQATRECEDCGVKVASGATSSYERVSGGGSPRGRSSPLGLAIWRLFLFPAGTHFAHPISCKPPTFLPHNEREI